jgi:hypothetical protein
MGVLPHQRFAFADHQCGTSLCIQNEFRSAVAKGCSKSAIGDYKSLMFDQEAYGRITGVPCEEIARHSPSRLTQTSVKA